jgi:hypothetical protein
MHDREEVTRREYEATKERFDPIARVLYEATAWPSLWGIGDSMDLCDDLIGQFRGQFLAQFPTL